MFSSDSVIVVIKSTTCAAHRMMSLISSRRSTYNRFIDCATGQRNIRSLQIARLCCILLLAKSSKQVGSMNTIILCLSICQQASLMTCILFDTDTNDPRGSIPMSNIFTLWHVKLCTYRMKYVYKLSKQKKYTYCFLYGYFR